MILWKILILEKYLLIEEKYCCLKSIDTCRVDVWWGVWQCTHAKLAPQMPHPLTQDRLTVHASEQGEWTFLPHFSSATGVCGWCDYTLPLFRILGLAGILAASGCLRVRPAWIDLLSIDTWKLLLKNIDTW